MSISELTTKQIDDYLSRTQNQNQLEGLREALHEDQALAELAKQPLILNILVLTYQGKTAEKTRREMQHTIFANYVATMLSRRKKLEHWNAVQVIHWLTFLAKQMQQHNQPDISIESLQPEDCLVFRSISTRPLSACLTPSLPT